VLKELPDKTVFRTVFEVDKDTRAEYDYALQDFLEWAYDEGGWQKLQKVKRAEAISKLTTLKKLCAKAKVKNITEHCREWLESNEDEQLIVFAHHRDVITDLANSFSEANFATMTIKGDDSVPKRQAVVDAFKKKEFRVLVASIQAAGTGVDGLQICQNMKFVERTWRPADMVQAEDRIHRIGQDEPCFVEYLDMHNSIDDKMHGIITQKMKIISKIVDGSAADAGDISNDVLNAMLEERKVA